MAGKSASGAANKAEMIRWLFENSRDLMHVVGADGRFKLVNARLEAAHRLGGARGGRRAAPSTSSIPTTSPGSATASARCTPGEVAENASAHDAQGRRIQLVRRAHPEDAQRRASSCTLRDATEERARAEELEETRRTRRLLSESAGIGTWLYEPLREPHRVVARPADPDRLRARRDRHPRAVLRRRAPGRPPADPRADDAAVMTGEGATLEHRMKVGGRWTSWRATFRTEPRAAASSRCAASPRTSPSSPGPATRPAAAN